MKKFIICESELRDLLRAAHYAWALEAGGVDNWTWEGESVKDYCANYGVPHIEDIVDKEISEGVYQELI